MGAKNSKYCDCDLKDKNKDGKCGVFGASSSKVYQTMCNMQKPVLDANFNGDLDADEFLTMVKGILAEEEDEEQEMKDAFMMMDKDKDGFISAAELRYMMCKLGDRVGDGEVQNMIKQADQDGDGLINYPEFVNMVSDVSKQNLS